jgi:aminoglycoside phosphotransferase (APT) family kinase protein
LDIELLSQRVAEHLRKEAGESVEDVVVSPLAGGACQDNFKVELSLGGKPTRLALRSDAVTSLPGSINRAAEFAILQHAVHRGVRTPRARFLARDLTRPGASAYFLDWVTGEAIGRKVLSSPELEGARASLPSALAQELAKIHALTPAHMPDVAGAAAALAPGFDAARSLLARIRGSIDAMHEPRPALELVHRWLLSNAPAGPSETVLVHGDFRTGHFMVAPEGLQAVLDWEFSHFGSPYEDLTWISARDWRFGQLHKPIGGFASRQAFYEAYESASGRVLDQKLLFFWEVFANFNWAVGAVYQGERYVFGGVDEFELVAIGRRASEMEFEAVRLIERGRL